MKVKYVDAVPEAPEAPDVQCIRCGFQTRILVVAYVDGDKDYECRCGLPLARIRGGKTYIWESNVLL